MKERGTYHAIVADDHAIVRSGLRTALETPGQIEERGIVVVAEAENGLEAIAACRAHRPDLLLLDVQMPMAGGIEVVVEVQRWSPDTRIVVLTGVSAVGIISSLVESGVHGLFSKGDDNSELYARLPGILRGQRHIATRFVNVLGQKPAGEQLTGRERQILNMIIAGHSNKEIAGHLGISAKTVDKHRTSMMQKLDVHSVPQLMAFALREGLVDPSAEL
ncbi:response regulator transcription factor [Oceanicola sp. 502str15]|uniref:LuxR C-terminal-related transcriptional regulator n=1 Tax=Oceanicola sp. 502str15 TaxID=2696061 RepID=UPI0020952125|nr:response regulator transcription factor [Oceanicola sp. 502str15]MCO6383060.1 response regulator [Oceanicola sp. 502str15]